MRDIRNDLQDRANLLDEQINAAEAQFESLVEQLRTEHESSLEDLKAELEAVSRLLEVEQRRLANIPVTPALTPAPAPKPQPRAQVNSPLSHPHVPQAPAHAQAHVQTHAQPHMQQAQPLPQAQPQQPVADFLVRTLNESGAMSRDDLRILAVREGYFADGEGAERGVHAALVSVNKAGLIRQLPNGNFAPASMMDAIRLRRAI
jgi:hypothetical protein